VVTRLQRQFHYFDGQKSGSLDNWPDEAWTITSNKQSKALTSAEELYSHVGIFYRCVQLRANTLASLPWVILRGDEEVWSSEDDVPEEFEHLENLVQLLYLTEAALSVVGEAFWMKDRNLVLTKAVRWLAPQTMTPNWTIDGLVNFTRQLGAQQQLLSVEQVAYFSLPNPFHETLPGVSPAHAAASAARVLWSVDRFVTGFFDRGAIKATLLTVAGNPQQTQMDKLETWWKRYFRGVASAWESIAIRAGVTPVTIGEGISELSNSELTLEQRQTISTTFGIPFSLLEANAANYATAQQDELNFYTQTIVPEARLVAPIINQQLLHELGLRLKFQPQQLALFQEDESERSISLLHLVQAGLPIKAALSQLGYRLTSEEEAALTEAVAESAALMRQASTTPRSNSATLARQGEGGDVPRVRVATPIQPVRSGDLNAETSQKAVETGQLQRWAKKLIKRGKTVDPDAFENMFLSSSEKMVILSELVDPVYLVDEKAVRLGESTIDPLLAEYENSLRALVEQAIRREIDAETFEIRLNELILSQFVEGFLLGVGALPLMALDALTAEARIVLRQLQQEQAMAIQEFTSDIFTLNQYTDIGDKVTDGLSRAFDRVVLWVLALAGAYALGQLYRQPTVKGEVLYWKWVIGNTLEHCVDCLRLNGQVHTSAEWLLSGFIPQGSSLACGGWRCDCHLESALGPSQGAL